MSLFGAEWGGLDEAVLFSIFVSLAVVLFGAPGVALAAPQDFTVNVTGDDDDGSCDGWTPETDCTLREAIIASNASPDAGTISFDIHGRGTATRVPTAFRTSPS